MCGIFGYIGKNNSASEITLEGLKLLEYRGYDSWGIAVNQKSKFIVKKKVGKIKDVHLNSEFLNLNSELAIGHTRWATHGGVTEANAHPHLDCSKKIAVVHNGIIENFETLKKDLIKNGHVFKSETDTEVLPHLIEENLKNNNFPDAVRIAFNALSGMNAIVVAYSPLNEIIAAKTGSPLVIGLGKDELFVASDASAIVKHTKKVYFLEDNQMAILGRKMKLLSLPSGKELKAKTQLLDWEFEEAEMGKYPHFFLKEVNEQPRVIENIALNYLADSKKLSELVKNAFGTIMMGCGTASYAGLAGTYLFSSIAKKHVNFTIGSEFKYLEDYLTPKTLVIPISQSGETIDIVDPVNRAHLKGAKIACLVNVLGSTLYRQSDYKILLGAGIEKAVVATKSFMSMISVLLLTAYTLSDNQTEGAELLKKAAKNVKAILQSKQIESIKKLAKELKKSEHIYLLGRGLSYATALEAALKIKETSCVHAEGFAGGELKHGVIALIEKGTPCFVFAPNDETYEEIISNAQEVKARGAFIIGVGPKNNNVFDRFFETDDIKEATIIPQVLISQLFAYYLALERGIEDPDKPRNLAKSVTVK
ncbi:MAG TPA: glutamine--fructose-6-phosphate transaminase (isomerizing) [Candidatus Saccharimonadales bacterium]|nr:glutamine--fructose-6-phosphate transaminase (isomerizing) [Candidatus Saccharimonadales bacterium]